MQLNYEYTYEYDSLERVSGKNIYFGENYLQYDYHYRSTAAGAGSLISEIAVGYQNDSNYLAFIYSYDANGNEITSETHIARINPIRYRSYYQDTDTGFHYLNTRYYDSTAGRFISPEPNVYSGKFDSGAGLTKYNVYVYCANNPVRYLDSPGEWTYSVGWSFSAFFIGGCTYSISLAFDSSGMVALDQELIYIQLHP